MNIFHPINIVLPFRTRASQFVVGPVVRKVLRENFWNLPVSGTGMTIKGSDKAATLLASRLLIGCLRSLSH